MVKKPSAELVALLNEAVSRELQVSVQYILQYTKMEKILRKVRAENILLGKTTYEELGKKLKSMAIEEMKHAATIMERLYYLGADATSKADKVTIGSTLKDFMELGYKAEEEALALYMKIIKLAESEGDMETGQIFRKIYTDEEKHLFAFEENLNIDIKEGEGPADIESKHTKGYTPEYFALLNKAVAAEIGAIVQYTNQHEKASKLALRNRESPLEVVADANKAQVVSDMLKKFAMQEMSHLDKIAERIHLLGGDTVTVPEPLPKIGETVDDFLRNGKEGEDFAIVLYRQIVKKASEIGDTVTRRLFQGIIGEEDGHYWSFDDYF
ncbi:MAG: hypothetical protein JW839_22640 [Candidatus Lokiarchaeota archaeon]|nr:hypothetical protein [Candidatus Lokiarchaeota archaeon]